MNHCLTYADVVKGLPLILLTTTLLSWLCGFFSYKILMKGKENE